MCFPRQAISKCAHAIKGASANLMANRLSKAAKDLETASKRVSEGTISEGAMDLLKAGFADLQKQKGALAAHIGEHTAAN